MLNLLIVFKIFFAVCWWNYTMSQKMSLLFVSL